MPGIPDAATPDAGSDPSSDAGPTGPKCAIPEPGQIGGACTEDSDCDPGPVDTGDAGPGDGGVAQPTGECFDEKERGPFPWPPEGFCTRNCSVDADCGTGNFCADLGDGFKKCMPACCGSVQKGEACSPDRICAENIFGLLPLNQPACIPGKVDAVDGEPCLDLSDCNINSFCRKDFLEAPSGTCVTALCTVGDDSTCAPGGDGHCVADYMGLEQLCIDACDSDNDCRTVEGYRCFDDAVRGKHCAHPEVGDECTTATDCGNAPPWDCLQGTDFPGGYCTRVACDVKLSYTCSLTSRCFDPNDQIQGDEFCATLCDNGNCRTGYTCQNNTICVPNSMATGG